MDVPNVIKELVKNSIDAQCLNLLIEVNDTFDVRVTDDGCGFNEEILHDIGKRQVISSRNLEEFRYGSEGKSLLNIAQITEEMYIESIERSSNVRFYKSINFHKSEFNVYSRELKDAITVTGPQGVSVVLYNLIFKDVIDAVSLQKDIIKGVVELALINYNIKISIKDTGTQKMLYETDGMDTLFRKFEDFLESNQFFARIRFVSCQKDNVKVEFFLCENGISTNNLQFVYFNKSIELDAQWKKIINDLCEKQFENVRQDLNAKFPVYLADIRVKNHVDSSRVVDNVIVNNCIQKCIQLMSQSSSKFNPTESIKKPKNKSSDVLEILNEDNPGSDRQTNGNEHKIQDVRLGDWIFNNSCENEMVDQDRNIYRNKICENWVISLEKSKPKDLNDSLKFVDIENIQQDDDDDKFKKPLERPIRKTKSCIKDTVPVVSQLVSPKLFKPSNYIDKFNSSSLMRASRQLITNREKETEEKMNSVTSKTSFHHLQQNWPKEKSLYNVQECLSRIVPNTPMPLSTAPSYSHFPPNNDSLHKTTTEAFNPPTPNNDFNLKDHFHHKSVKATFDFQFHSNHRQSDLNIFENNQSTANAQCYPPQSRNHGNRFESSVAETPQIHFQHRRRSSSLSTFHRSEISSRVSKNRRSKSRSSLNSQTTVASSCNDNSSNRIISHRIGQSKWPVTININFK